VAGTGQDDQFTLTAFYSLCNFIVSIFNTRSNKR